MKFFAYFSIWLNHVSKIVLSELLLGIKFLVVKKGTNQKNTADAKQRIFVSV